MTDRRDSIRQGVSDVEITPLTNEWGKQNPKRTASGRLAPHAQAILGMRESPSYEPSGLQEWAGAVGTTATSVYHQTYRSFAETFEGATEEGSEWNRYWDDQVKDADAWFERNPELKYEMGKYGGWTNPKEWLAGITMGAVQSAPAIGAALVAGPAGGTAAAAAMMGTIFTQRLGDNMDWAQKLASEGDIDADMAPVLGLGMALFEAGTETGLGFNRIAARMFSKKVAASGLKSLGKKEAKSIGAKLMRGQYTDRASSFLRAYGKAGKGFAGRALRGGVEEGMEEIIQGVGRDVAEKVYAGKSFDDLGTYFNQFMAGFSGGIGLSGVFAYKEAKTEYDFERTFAPLSADERANIETVDRRDYGGRFEQNARALANTLAKGFPQGAESLAETIKVASFRMYQAQKGSEYSQNIEDFFQKIKFVFNDAEMTQEQFQELGRVNDPLAKFFEMFPDAQERTYSVADEVKRLQRVDEASTTAKIFKEDLNKVRGRVEKRVQKGEWNDEIAEDVYRLGGVNIKVGEKTYGVKATHRGGIQIFDKPVGELDFSDDFDKMDSDQLSVQTAQRRKVLFKGNAYPESRSTGLEEAKHKLGNLVGVEEQAGGAEAQTGEGVHGVTFGAGREDTVTKEGKVTQRAEEKQVPESHIVLNATADAGTVMHEWMHYISKNRLMPANMERHLVRAFGPDKPRKDWTETDRRGYEERLSKGFETFLRNQNYGFTPTEELLNAMEHLKELMGDSYKLSLEKFRSQGGTHWNPIALRQFREMFGDEYIPDSMKGEQKAGEEAPSEEEAGDMPVLVSNSTEPIAEEMSVPEEKIGAPTPMYYHGDDFETGSPVYKTAPREETIRMGEEGGVWRVVFDPQTMNTPYRLAEGEKIPDNLGGYTHIHRADGAVIPLNADLEPTNVPGPKENVSQEETEAEIAEGLEPQQPTQAPQRGVEGEAGVDEGVGKGEGVEGAQQAVREPWEMTADEIDMKHAAFNGIRIVRQTGGKDDGTIASFDAQGRIRVRDSFFDLSPENRRRVLKHEVSHYFEEQISPKDKARYMGMTEVDQYRGKNVNEKLANMIADGALPDEILEDYPDLQKTVKDEELSDLSYKELQKRAKELGVKGNLKREEMESEIASAREKAESGEEAPDTATEQEVLVYEDAKKHAAYVSRSGMERYAAISKNTRKKNWRVTFIDRHGLAGHEEYPTQERAEQSLEPVFVPRNHVRIDITGGLGLPSENYAGMGFRPNVKGSNLDSSLRTWYGPKDNVDWFTRRLESGGYTYQVSNVERTGTPEQAVEEPGAPTEQEVSGEQVENPVKDWSWLNMRGDAGNFMPITPSGDEWFGGRTVQEVGKKIIQKSYAERKKEGDIVTFTDENGRKWDAVVAADWGGRGGIGLVRPHKSTDITESEWRETLELQKSHPFFPEGSKKHKAEWTPEEMQQRFGSGENIAEPLAQGLSDRTGTESEWERALTEYAEPVRRAVLKGVSPLAQQGGVRSRTVESKAAANAHQRLLDGEDRGDVWRDTGFWMGYDGKLRFEIEPTEMLFDTGEYRNLAGGQYEFIEMENLIEHDKLFDAYPELRGMPVYTGEEYETSYIGKDDYGNVAIFLKDDSPEEVRDSLVHEVQHAIQDIEGFEPGGSPRTALKRMDEEYDDLDDEIQALKDAGRSTELLEKRREHIANLDKYDRYRLLPGEAEARMVQARLDMTPEERSEEPPWETMRQMLIKEDLLPTGMEPQDVLAQMSGEEVQRSLSKVFGKVQPVSDDGRTVVFETESDAIQSIPRLAVEGAEKVGAERDAMEQPLAQDEQYLDLAEKPEENAAELQRMVDERAKDAGYEIFYHGTDAEFDTNSLQEGQGILRQGIYTTHIRDAAQDYGRNIIRIAVKPDNVLDLRDGEQLLDYMMEHEILEDTDKDTDLADNIRVGRPFQVDPFNKFGFMDDVVGQAEEDGYDVLQLADDLGQPQEDNYATVVVNRSAMKLAQPVTLNEQDEIVPLSERFNPERQEIYAQMEDYARSIDAPYSNGEITIDDRVRKQFQRPWKTDMDDPVDYHENIVRPETQLSSSFTALSDLFEDYENEQFYADTVNRFAEMEPDMPLAQGEGVGTDEGFVQEELKKAKRYWNDTLEYNNLRKKAISEQSLFIAGRLENTGDILREMGKKFVSSAYIDEKIQEIKKGFGREYGSPQHLTEELNAEEKADLEKIIDDIKNIPEGNEFVSSLKKMMLGITARDASTVNKYLAEVKRATTAELEQEESATPLAQTLDNQPVQTYPQLKILEAMKYEIQGDHDNAVEILSKLKDRTGPENNLLMSEKEELTDSPDPAQDVYAKLLDFSDTVEDLDSFQTAMDGRNTFDERFEAVRSIRRNNGHIYGLDNIMPLAQTEDTYEGRKSRRHKIFKSGKMSSEQMDEWAVMQGIAKEGEPNPRRNISVEVLDGILEHGPEMTLEMRDIDFKAAMRNKRIKDESALKPDTLHTDMLRYTSGNKFKQRIVRKAGDVLRRIEQQVTTRAGIIQTLDGKRRGIWNDATRKEWEAGEGVAKTAVHKALEEFNAELDKRNLDPDKLTHQYMSITDETGRHDVPLNKVLGIYMYLRNQHQHEALVESNYEVTPKMAESIKDAVENGTSEQAKTLRSYSELLAEQVGRRYETALEAVRKFEGRELNKVDGYWMIQREDGLYDDDDPMGLMFSPEDKKRIKDSFIKSRGEAKANRISYENPMMKAMEYIRAVEWYAATKPHVDLITKTISERMPTFGNFTKKQLREYVDTEMPTRTRKDRMIEIAQDEWRNRMSLEETFEKKYGGTQLLKTIRDMNRRGQYHNARTTPLKPLEMSMQSGRLRFVSAILPYRITTPFVQTLSGPTGLSMIPGGMRSVAAYTRHFKEAATHMSAHGLHSGTRYETTGHPLENTEIGQIMKKRSPHVFARTLAILDMEDFERRRGMMQRRIPEGVPVFGGKSIFGMGMFWIKFLDASTVAGVYGAAYEHMLEINKKEGMSKEDAEVDAADYAAYVIESTQPPSSSHEKSLVQTESETGKLLTTFQGFLVNQFNYQLNTVIKPVLKAFQQHGAGAEGVREAFKSFRGSDEQSSGLKKIAMGVILPALAIGMIRRRRPPEEDEWASDIVSYMFAPIPIAGPILANPIAYDWRDYGATPVYLSPLAESAGVMHDIVKGDLSGRTSESALNAATQFSGVSQPLAKYGYNIARWSMGMMDESEKKEHFGGTAGAIADLSVRPSE